MSSEKSRGRSKPSLYATVQTCQFFKTTLNSQCNQPDCKIDLNLLTLHLKLWKHQPALMLSAGGTISAPAQLFSVIISFFPAGSKVRQSKCCLQKKTPSANMTYFGLWMRIGGTFHLLNTTYPSVKTKDTSFICTDL